MNNESPMFRPPAEAFSLILRVAFGCPWNRCRFCGMYKTVKYRTRPAADWQQELEQELMFGGRVRRVFLADGDALALPSRELCDILQTLNDRIPRLQRVNSYANGRSILAKSREELRQLRRLKLHTLYVGLESGDAQVLKTMQKGETPEDMIGAARHAHECGFRLSVMVLIGLGGRRRSAEHAAATARVLNAMQPRQLSFLRVVPVPATALGNDVANGSFEEPTEFETVQEIRNVIADLELKQTVFRANHVSNAIPLEGRFPADKDRLLNLLQQLLDSDVLDRDAPSPHPASL